MNRWENTVHGKANEVRPVKNESKIQGDLAVQNAKLKCGGTVEAMYPVEGDGPNRRFGLQVSGEEIHSIGGVQ